MNLLWGDGLLIELALETDRQAAEARKPKPGWTDAAKWVHSELVEPYFGSHTT